MPEQDTLRLAAEVVDKYSGPLKKMMEELKKLSQGAKDVHAKGKKETDEHEKAYKRLREQLIRVKETTTDALMPAFNALGITVLTVSGSIAAISESVRKFGEYGQKLEFVHRASGLLTSTIRGLAEENTRYGVSIEDTMRSFDEFGAHMNQFARRSPIYMNEWKKYPQIWSELGRQLAFGGLTREQQLKKAMEYVPTLRDVDARKRVLALLGLPENWAYLTEKEMRAMEQKAASFTNRFPFDAKAAKDAQKAWADLIITMHGFRDQIGNTFAEPIANAVKSLDTALQSKVFLQTMHDIHDTAVATGKLFSDWHLNDEFKRDMATLDATAKEIKAIVEFFNHMKQSETPGSKAYKDLDNSKSWWNRPMFRGKDSLWNQWFGGDKQGQADTIQKGVYGGLYQFFSQQMTPAQQLAAGLRPVSYTTTGPSTPDYAHAFHDAGGYHVQGVTVGKGASGAMLPLGSKGNPVSGSLAEQRARFVRELQSNPALRDQLMRVMYNEQGANALGTEGIAESAMNRALVRGTSLAAQLRWHGLERGGYYQPGNMGRGALENPRIRAILERSIDNALAGSNVVRGATDNSSGGLAMRERESGRFRFLKGIHGESFFAPGWGEPALAQSWNRWNSITSKTRDMITRGRSSPGDAELLRRGVKADDLRGLDGNAKLTIDLNGFPRGTRFAQRADGIFKQVTLNRGRPMALGSEVS